MTASMIDDSISSAQACRMSGRRLSAQARVGDIFRDRELCELLMSCGYIIIFRLEKREALKTSFMNVSERISYQISIKLQISTVRLEDLLSGASNVTQSLRTN